MNLPCHPCDIPEAETTDYSQMTEAEKRLDRIKNKISNRKLIEVLKKKGIKVTIK